MMSSKNCPVCSETILETAESCFLQEKGAEEVNECSKQRGSNLVVQTGTEVHVNCRRRYTYKKDIERCSSSFFQTDWRWLYKGAKWITALVFSWCACWNNGAMFPENQVFHLKQWKKFKELQFKLNLIFLAKILHILSTQDYLQLCVKDSELNSNFLIILLNFSFRCKNFSKATSNK